MIWPMNGAFGQNAGNITLTVGSFYSAPGKTNRFVARGGRGGDPGIGASGIDGISLPVPNNLGQPSQANNQEGLTASTYTDASLLSLKSAVEKLTVLPPQMAPQILGARGQSVAQHVADCPQVQADETIANKGKKSLSGAAWRVLSKIEEWCALQVSNLLGTLFSVMGQVGTSTVKPRLSPLFSMASIGSAALT